MVSYSDLGVKDQIRDLLTITFLPKKKTCFVYIIEYKRAIRIPSNAQQGGARRYFS